MDHNIGFCDGPSFCTTGIIQFKLFKILFDKHKQPMVLVNTGKFSNAVSAVRNKRAYQKDGGIACPEAISVQNNTFINAIWQARSHNLTDPQSLGKFASSKSGIFRMLNYACP